MPTRRDFLRLAATATGASLLPASIARALAIPANRATGTIKDVEHVVILMQENRSFDHYFGTLRGVRGFNDPRPARLPSGKPVWYQPTPSVKTHHYHDRGLHPSAEHVLPFYLNPKQTSEFQAGTDHGWSSGHGAWNNGHHNQWVNQKQDVLTMGYLRREDVAFHYALADAFTLCDAYHCSVHANTAPNRVYLWSGTIDAANALGKRRNGPGFGERDQTNGFTWTTYPERLEKAGISWKLYQGGTGIPGDPTDNYTDNSLEFFAQYQVKEGADPHGPLVQKGVTDRSLIGFREDCLSGKLAQVTWVIAPYKYSEHPEASPRDGAFYVNTVLEALTANPDLWSKTVFLINYDENDGLFDHIVPPMPPLIENPQKQNAQGMVTPDLVASLVGSNQDEFIDMDKYPHERRPLVPGTDPGGLQPIGLGPRVPMLVISPWSTGGYVCSETFDHTSVLQFLEKRFDIPEPNINPWRRAICGDLTSAFDFAGTSNPAIVKVPVPAVLDSLKQPYSVPEVQTMPTQEPGTRPARPLPYMLYTHSRIEAGKGKIFIDFRNEGRAGAAFYARNHILPQLPPRRYSISAGQSLADYWLISDNGSEVHPKEPRTEPDYDISIHGPNGFFTHFRGAVAYPPSRDPEDNEGAKLQPNPEATIRCDRETGAVHLTLTNTGKVPCTLKVVNTYAASEAPHQLHLDPGATAEDHWLSAPTHNWFDISITTEDSPTFLRRFAAHIETGKPSHSDPAAFVEEA
jgi:phospholipase C